MISGSAMIECGMGSVGSVCGLNESTGIGVVAMRSRAPGKIGIVEYSEGEFDSIISNAEVAIFFHNIESLESLMHSFTQLHDMMLEKANKKTED